MIAEALQKLHRQRIIEPMFGNHLREAVQAVRVLVHVHARKKCEDNCPGCAELGLSGSRAVHPDIG